MRATWAANVRDCLLRKVFGYKEGVLTGEWSKTAWFWTSWISFLSPPHHHPHSYSGDQITTNETGRAQTYRKESNGHAVSLGKPEGKEQHVKSSLRWKDNISQNFKGIWWEGVDWIYLTQDGDKWRLFVMRVTHIRVRSNAENVLSGRGTVQFQRRAISEQERMWKKATVIWIKVIKVKLSLSTGLN